MPIYSDTSRDAFERALRSMSESLPSHVLEELRRLLADERLHEPDLIRQAIERPPPEKEPPDAD